MAGRNKLELLLELSDRLFNNALTGVQQRLRSGVDSMEQRLEGFNRTQRQIFAHIGENFDSTKINQLSELFGEISGQMDFVNDINKTKVALQQMGVIDVDTTASSINSLSKKMEEDQMSIARAANGITKQMGGTMTGNIDLMEKAFNKGANLNGDMIDQIKEYPAQMQAMGMPIKTYLAIMAQSGKDGVFSDKAIDSLKEGGLALREFGKNQEAALLGLGLSKKDLAGKNTWEAIQLVLKSMDKAGLTVQQKQMALTDLFKGAGEDAGQGFLQGLARGIPDFDKIPEFEIFGNGLTGWISKFQNKLADAAGEWMPFIQFIGMGAITIASIISILTTLNEVLGISKIVTRMMTAEQWSLNAAMYANPVGIIIAAIVALVAIIGIAIYKYDEWGAALLQFLGPIGWVINAFQSIKDHWDSIVNAFKTDGIIGGLKRIHLVLMDTFLKPLQQILEMISEFDPTGLSDGLLKRVSDFRTQNKLVTTGEMDVRQKAFQGSDEQKGYLDAMMAYDKRNSLYKAQTLDGLVGADDGKKDKKGSKKTKDDINKVTGQANQVKKIDIKIDSFNKGGINITNEKGKGMSADDVEKWMKEMFMRIIIDAENA
ncbi:phage tail tape measure protein [Algoriella sp.]|uniref:phage tail tape measure protein n=1 Tax=Algoriella sp. TaxID=1872434 RepID=UPI002FCBDE72